MIFSEIKMKVYKRVLEILDRYTPCRAGKKEVMK